MYIKVKCMTHFNICPTFGKLKKHDDKQKKWSMPSTPRVQLGLSPVPTRPISFHAISQVACSVYFFRGPWLMYFKRRVCRMFELILFFYVMVYVLCIPQIFRLGQYGFYHSFIIVFQSLQFKYNQIELLRGLGEHFVI